MKTKARRGAWLLIAALMCLTVGLGIFFYPTVSDQLNRYRQGQVVLEYRGIAEKLDRETCEKMLQEAEAYNRTLTAHTGRFLLTDEEKAEYEALLDVTGTGVMAYVEIPKIAVSLPIYHGTNEKVLQTAIGHLEGSSLPVGGTGTHAVISGHRGLPSARLFTDIDQLEEGDHFLIRVLDRTLTYEVDQIRVVLPEETDELLIDPEEDYCTLITCTPYGVNTHRLLVRGTRVPNDETETAETVAPAQLSPLLVIPLATAPALLIVIIVLLIRTGKRKRSVPPRE